MFLYLSSIFASVGASIITCAFMEAYYQRRATEEVGRYDKEEGRHERA